METKQDAQLGNTSNHSVRDGGKDDSRIASETGYDNNVNYKSPKYLSDAESGRGGGGEGGERGRRPERKPRK